MKYTTMSGWALTAVILTLAFLSGCAGARTGNPVRGTGDFSYVSSDSVAEESTEDCCVPWVEPYDWDQVY